MCRVAICAKAMSAIATIQVTTMEFVIGKPNGRAISTALCDSADMLCPSFARVMPRRQWPRLLRCVPRSAALRRAFAPLRGNTQAARF